MSRYKLSVRKVRFVSLIVLDLAGNSPVKVSSDVRVLKSWSLGERHVGTLPQAYRPKYHATHGRVSRHQAEDSLAIDPSRTRHRCCQVREL
jgi:hypothetical protein